MKLLRTRGAGKAAVAGDVWIKPCTILACQVGEREGNLGKEQCCQVSEA